MNKRGFTLIELLVVVLIIGILAAIALPQYTKTVERARATEIITLGKSVLDSIDRLAMENPTLVENLAQEDLLDIDLPASAGSNCWDYTTPNKKFVMDIYIDNGVGFVNARRTNFPDCDNDMYEIIWKTYPSNAEALAANSDNSDCVEGRYYKEIPIYSEQGEKLVKSYFKAQGFCVPE